MESGERQRLQSIIAILVQRLGGDVTVTESEINDAKTIEVRIDPDGINIKSEVKNG